MFTPSHYASAKQKSIALIKQTHDWEGGEGFIADGAICPAIYAKQEVRVVCLLAESYGYNNCGVTDIETQPTDDILGVGHANRPTAKIVPALMWLVFEALQRGHKLTASEFPTFKTVKKEYTELLQGAMKRIAWVNVKKASKDSDAEGTQMNSGDIRAAAKRNSQVLRLQLDSLSPHLIIAFGVSVFEGMLEEGFLGEGIVRQKRWVPQRNTAGQFVLEATHPGYHSDWSYEGILNLHGILFDALRS